MNVVNYLLERLGEPLQRAAEKRLERFSSPSNFHLQAIASRVVPGALYLEVDRSRSVVV